jgi:hypothetical protein
MVRTAARHPIRKIEKSRIDLAQDTQTCNNWRKAQRDHMHTSRGA